MSKLKKRPQFDLFEDSILTQNIGFQRYDLENPEVYNRFKELTFQAIDKGFKYFSARGLFQVMRFEKGAAKDDGYKLNNNHTPYYVRKFVKEFPQHKTFFERRKTKYTTI